MPEAAIREPEQIRRNCAEKLRPMETSGRLRAVLGFFLCEKWTQPLIAELCLADDNSVVARSEGSVVFKHFLGPRNDLIRNVHCIARAAGLDGDETGFLLAGIARIKRPG